MAKARGQVRVAGTCAAGHVTRAVSDPGRNTWQGTCATDGCNLTVKARRIPAERVPKPAAAAAGATPPEPDPYEVVEVSYDVPTPARERRPAARADAAGDPIDQPPAGSPVAPLSTPAAGSGDGNTDHGAADGRRRRWPFQRDAAAARAPRAPVEFRTPFDD